jgi:hypothetical protein
MVDECVRRRVGQWQDKLRKRAKKKEEEEEIDTHTHTHTVISTRRKCRQTNSITY